MASPRASPARLYYASFTIEYMISFTIFEKKRRVRFPLPTQPNFLVSGKIIITVKYPVGG